MAVPSAEEINPYSGDLDGRVAVEHFLGKTVSEAAALFEDSPLTYQEDLMWMGPVAFAYYLPAAVHYVESEAADGDSDMVHCLRVLIEFRLDNDPDGLAPAFPAIRRLADHVANHVERFDLASDSDVVSGFRDLRDRVTR